MFNSEYLKELIATNKTDLAIEELLRFTKDFDEDIYHQVIMQRAKFEENNANEINGLLLADETRMVKAQIDNSLLKIIKGLSKKKDGEIFSKLLKEPRKSFFKPSIIISLISALVVILLLFLFIQNNRQQLLICFKHIECLEQFKVKDFTIKINNELIPSHLIKVLNDDLEIPLDKENLEKDNVIELSYENDTCYLYTKESFTLACWSKTTLTPTLKFDCDNFFKDLKNKLKSWEELSAKIKNSRSKKACEELHSSMELTLELFRSKAEKSMLSQQECKSNYAQIVEQIDIPKTILENYCN